MLTLLQIKERYIFIKLLILLHSIHDIIITTLKWQDSEETEFKKTDAAEAEISWLFVSSMG